MRDIKLLHYAAPVLVLALGASIYGLLQANKPEPEKREEAVRPITVFVERIESSDVSLDVITQGEVRSRIAIDLVSQVSGRIIHVSDEFMEGGSVAPGEPLVLIEDTDYQLSLDQSEARVAEARVRVELALADADVARKQLRGTPNPSDLALKKPQLAEAKAVLKAAQADLEQARVNLERTRVSVPFVGRMASTYVDFGQYITAGTALGSAFATDRVEVRLPISYDQLAALGLPIGFVAESGAGLPVEFTARVAGREQQWRGELKRLDAAIDSDTRLLYAIAEVEDPYGENRSKHGMPMAVGLYVSAKIRGREIADAVRIPRGALRAGNTVYVLGEDGGLDIRNVRVTHSSPVHAVIADGLMHGEKIIVSTIRNPIPGMALRAGSPDSSSVAGNEQVADGQG